MDEIAQTLLLLDQQLLVHPEQAVALDQAVGDLVDVDFRQRMPRLDVVGKRLPDVERGVRCNDLLGRTILRVQIDRERLA